MKNIIKEIEGFNGYFVSMDGRVYSNKKKVRLEGARAGFTWIETNEFREMKQSLRRGYKRVSLFRNGKYISKSVHRLVMETFDARPNENMLVCHLNDDPFDNRIDNLYWGTPAENSAQMVKNGRSLKGSKNPYAKLTEDQARLIKARFKEGITRQGIADEFKVSVGAIDKIKYGQAWSHITI